MSKQLPQEDTDMAEEIGTVVIGGGQAGLALSYYLSH
jgi:cation diffusion facilitator CzcD-associated flavoprotein CzcO